MLKIDDIDDAEDIIYRSVFNDKTKSKKEFLFVLHGDGSVSLGDTTLARNVRAIEMRGGKLYAKYEKGKDAADILGAGDEPYNYNVKIDARGKATIKRYYYKPGTTEINIISSYEGHPVKKIASSAFCGLYQVKKIVIPDSITEIGNHAFKNCRSLETVVIPEKVKAIKDGTFEGCNNLRDINR